MQDFTRITGEIVSSPLNENFRRLLTDIDIVNTNLVFPDKDLCVNTITDMLNISEPVNAQVCYVISSGEMYRYYSRDEKWHKIMDVGQTFRQGFLNSGVVVMSDKLKLKEGSKSVLVIPEMLVYFKNKPGDDRYLKGMYLLESKELDITTKATSANSYSIYVDYIGNFTVSIGMPKTDNPNLIYLGTFLLNKKKEIVADFIYTLPDIPFTDDRGRFLLLSGECSGLTLAPAGLGNNKVLRKEGYYYDEGINVTIGDTSNYPIDTDNGSNWNLKYFAALSPVNSVYYMIPSNPLNNDILKSEGLIGNKYWDGTALADVEKDYYTIQHHLVTPNGQDIIVYGDAIYNSIDDAISNINTTTALEIDFPYVEVTRIVVGNVANLSSDDTTAVRFYGMGRLAQVGTITPEFADSAFKLYSGDKTDTIPASLQISLEALQQENFNNTMTLYSLPYSTERQLSGIDKKYITDTIINNVPKTMEAFRQTHTTASYDIADAKDLEFLQNRVTDLEKEIWGADNSTKQRYEQSVKYRLYHDELILDDHEARLRNHETRITNNEKNKVNKNTTINGYKLGDTANKDEAKGITLYTDDINEKVNARNLWYTEERVTNNPTVTMAAEHARTISKGTTGSNYTPVNPHGISTDDIRQFSSSKYKLVTAEEKNRIGSDKLPEDTKKELRDLDSKKMDTLSINVIEGSSAAPGDGPLHLGDVKSLRFYEQGINLSIDQANETAIIECVGQINSDTVMFRNKYAREELENPVTYAGYVDKAIYALNTENVHGIEDAGANKYYGTNTNGNVGTYDLPVYVSTADAESFASIDQVVFVPVDNSVTLSHLEPTLRNTIQNNYHKVYNSGSLSSQQINTFNFGDNLSVTVNGNTATINATGGSGSGETRFINLADVDLMYSGNEGKMLVVNETGTGITVSSLPVMKDYMLKRTYIDTVDPTKVKKAVLADSATLATTASNSLTVGGKTVNDNLTTDKVLWTANQIVNFTNRRIGELGVQTYSGTTVPENSLGKNGDIYVLLED